MISDSLIFEAQELLLALCRIPAPSLQEDARASFCRDWLQAAGYDNVRIDPAKNAVCSLGDTGENGLVLFMAHTDTVFPDSEPFMPQIRENRLFCPGCGDDTANLAILLMLAKILKQSARRPDYGILFAANAGEEGLGNLKGCRRLMEDYGPRIREVISFDLSYDKVYVRAVGSSRYRISVRTEGGHSFANFGRPNAIHQISRLIDALYRQPIPEIPDTKTTFNVGRISGGTSVNTIAQQAEMLYEYRSDSNECLDVMEGQLQEILGRFWAEGLDLSAESIGKRPGMGICRDPEAQENLIQRSEDAIRSVVGKSPLRQSASTDCNLPFSLGIPAVCFGLVSAGDAHTREEWVDLPSVADGLKIALSFAESYFNA